jgi:hypothetical protein
MNGRIKELAHHAGFISKKHNGDEWRWGYIDPELNEKLEKFAELIIRECMELVEDYTKTRTHNTHYDADEQIKVNFGVE